MKIGIIGATGKLGSILLSRLDQMGETPVAIVRDKSKLEGVTPYIEKSIFDLTTKDVEGFDVLVNAFNAPFEDPSQFITSMDRLIEILRGTSTHLIVAGGGGVLLVDSSTMLVDTGEIPQEFEEIAKGEVEAYKNLAKEKNINWTYMAPPAVMDYNSPYTGNYRFSGDKLGINDEGKSFISYQDYAEAFINKIFNLENHSIVGVFS